MHIPSSMDDEFTIELWCREHKCNVVALSGAIRWIDAWMMFKVYPEHIHCPKKDEFNGECFVMMLTEPNRYLHGPHCRGVVIGDEMPGRTANRRVEP